MKKNILAKDSNCFASFEFLIDIRLILKAVSVRSYTIQMTTKIEIENKMLSYRRETALQGAL